MILFGIRSPIVVEVEETCSRLGLEIIHAVSISGVPRLSGNDAIVELADFAPIDGSEFFASAFVPKRRLQLIEQGKKLGMKLARALVDPTAIVARSVHRGAGTYVNSGAIVGGETKLGIGVSINRAVSIGHHCVVDDYVSIGPGATLGADIKVGAGTVICTGAVVLPGIRIGDGAIIGGGSLVREDVPDGCMVIGNPGRLQRYDAQTHPYTVPTDREE